MTEAATGLALVALSSSATSVATALVFATLITALGELGPPRKPLSKDWLGILVGLSCALPCIILVPVLSERAGVAFAIGMATGLTLGVRFAHLRRSRPSASPTMKRRERRVMAGSIMLLVLPGVVGAESALGALGLVETSAGLGALLTSATSPDLGRLVATALILLGQAGLARAAVKVREVTSRVAVPLEQTKSSPHGDSRSH